LIALALAASASPAAAQGPWDGPTLDRAEAERQFVAFLEDWNVADHPNGWYCEVDLVGYEWLRRAIELETQGIDAGPFVGEVSCEMKPWLAELFEQWQRNRSRTAHRRIGRTR
jgi:hypothetical protein